MTVSTAAYGKFYTVVGSVSEVAAELNRVNARPERIIVAGDDGSGTFTVLVGRP